MTAPVSVKLLDPRAKRPAYGSPDAAGADLYVLTDGPVTIAPGETVLLHTGLAFAIPKGYVGLVCARSSLGAKKGLAPANKVGIIDADYRGEVRVARLLIVPYLTAEFIRTDELDTTQRGSGGFGSTGIK